MGGEKGDWWGELETGWDPSTGVLGVVDVSETPESVVRGDPMLDMLGESAWAEGGGRMETGDTGSIVGGAAGADE